MEGQGQAAKDQAGDQGQPLAFFQFALGNEQCAVNRQGTDDQYCGGAVDTAHADFVTGKVDDPGIDFVDDEKQEQRDEVDELFHSGSQKQDVAA